jgi:hypothetical protein
LVSNVVTRFATREPTLCAVCRRHAVSLGYAPMRSAAIVWLCDDHGCHGAVEGAYKMPTSTLDAYEIGAALEAGALAGRYLDEIGTSDLAALDRDQWREFLRRLFVGFEHAMRRKILENEPPF